MWYISEIISNAVIVRDLTTQNLTSSDNWTRLTLKDSWKTDKNIPIGLPHKNLGKQREKVLLPVRNYYGLWAFFQTRILLWEISPEINPIGNYDVQPEVNLFLNFPKYFLENDMRIILSFFNYHSNYIIIFYPVT